MPGLRTGFYLTIATALGNADSGDDIYLDSESYTEDVDMPSNFELYGVSESTAIIHGDVTFNGVSSSRIVNMKGAGEIIIDSGSSVYIDFVTAEDVIDIDLGSGHQVWQVYTQSSGYVNLYSTESMVDDVTSYNSELKTAGF